jgi:hypothetical protein
MGKLFSHDPPRTPVGGFLGDAVHNLLKSDPSGFPYSLAVASFAPDCSRRIQKEDIPKATSRITKVQVIPCLFIMALTDNIEAILSPIPQEPCGSSQTQAQPLRNETANQIRPMHDGLYSQILKG